MTVPIFSDPLPAQQRQVGALLWVGAVSRLTMADTPRASSGPASRKVHRYWPTIAQFARSLHCYAVL